MLPVQEKSMKTLIQRQKVYPEPKLTGKTISRSFFVKPGIKYSKSW